MSLDRSVILYRYCVMIGPVTEIRALSLFWNMIKWRAPLYTRYLPTHIWALSLDDCCISTSWEKSFSLKEDISEPNFIVSSLVTTVSVAWSHFVEIRGLRLIRTLSRVLVYSQAHLKNVFLLTFFFPFLTRSFLIPSSKVVCVCVSMCERLCAPLTPLSCL